MNGLSRDAIKLENNESAQCSCFKNIGWWSILKQWGYLPKCDPWDDIWVTKMESDNQDIM